MKAIRLLIFFPPFSFPFPYPNPFFCPDFSVKSFDHGLAKRSEPSRKSFRAVLFFAIALAIETIGGGGIIGLRHLIHPV